MSPRSPHRLSLLLLMLPLLPLAVAWAPQPLPAPRPEPRPRPAPRVDRDARLPVVEEKQREQRWQLPVGPAKVVVDAIDGSIRVRAVDGDAVTLRVRETVRGRDAAAIERARREMPLRLSQDGGTVEAFVESPYRSGKGFQGDWGELPYRVRYDFEVTVPRRAAVVLSTVNDGDVELSGTEGAFEVRNVNGAVRVREVAGAGTARTVNGSVSVSYRRNPTADLELATVNGDVTVELLPGASVDLRYTTMNGEGWSDFPFSLAPRPATIQAERRDGRVKIGGRWQEGIRIGAGGPLISLQTLNGDVLVKSRRAEGAS